MATTRLVLGVALMFAASCSGGDDGPAPFILQINSGDVVLTAVHRIELVIEPSDLDRRFMTVPDGTHAGGQIFTRVSAAGEYVVTIESGYITQNAQMGGTGVTFTLDVPFRPAVEMGSPPGDPVLHAAFIRGTERIAAAQRFLPWPLPSGGEAIVTVTCTRIPEPGFFRQCTNNDGVDAGPPAPDAGPPAPDAAAAADSGPAPDGG